MTDNVAFFQQALKTAAAVRTTAKDKLQSEEDQERERLEYLLTELNKRILHKWQEKVTEATTKGFTQTNLFSYFAGERFDGKGITTVRGTHLAFLFNGPRENGKSFWETRKIVPLVDRIRAAVAPASVRVWYTGRNGNVVSIDWSGILPGSDDAKQAPEEQVPEEQVPEEQVPEEEEVLKPAPGKPVKAKKPVRKTKKPAKKVESEDEDE